MALTSEEFAASLERLVVARHACEGAADLSDEVVIALWRFSQIVDRGSSVLGLMLSVDGTDPAWKRSRYGLEARLDFGALDDFLELLELEWTEFFGVCRRNGIDLPGLGR